jgi:hypothetical protein
MHHHRTRRCRSRASTRTRRRPPSAARFAARGSCRTSGDVGARLPRVEAEDDAEEDLGRRLAFILFGEQEDDEERRGARAEEDAADHYFDHYPAMIEGAEGPYEKL